MKYDLFIKTLERGRDIGLGRKFNISDILQKEFPKPTTTDRNTWNEEIIVQLDVLKDMQTHLHIIKFRDTEVNKVYWQGNQVHPEWFDSITFDIWVTVAGLDYLNQYYLRQSNFGLNSILESNTKLQTGFDQVIANNSGIQATASRRQTQIFRWTAVFAFVAMAISGISLWKDFHKDKLLQSISQKDSSIRTLQKNLYHLKIDSSRLSEAMKTLPKKK
ncbi:MAG: hypothetical protein JWR54_3415 [Mucilaginibacter sp.]|nr:hypothetical protein [Mucilaginibacter sp.]